MLVKKKKLWSTLPGQDHIDRAMYTLPGNPHIYITYIYISRLIEKLIQFL